MTITPSDTFVRRIHDVDRLRSPWTMLEAAAHGRTKYWSPNVLTGMPRGEGACLEVVFFRVDLFMGYSALEEEYDRRVLNPVDPYSLGAVNEADPSFADEFKNGTIWKNRMRNWYFLAFGRSFVSAHRRGFEWNGQWWFGGVPK